MKRTLVAALAVALSTPSRGWAQTDLEREARRCFERGVELADDNDFNAAMVEFTRAYELTRNPQLLYNVAVTHEALAHYVEAMDTLARYRAEAPPAVLERRRGEIDATLARLAQRVGTLRVLLNLPGLVVRVDGLEREASRAPAGLTVNAGRHRVALAAPGHESRELEVDVAGAQVVTISETLPRRRSTLAIELDLPGAEVLVDGVVAATTPVLQPLAVDEGTHRVEVRRPGYTSYGTVVEAIGQGARVRPSLAWEPRIPPGIAARLRLVTRETEISATLDGQPIRPDGDQDLPPGPHRLRVERQGFLALEQGLSLPPGEATTVRLSLTPTPSFRAEYFAAAQRARVVAWSFLGVGAVLLGGGGAGIAYTSVHLDDLTREFSAGDARATQCEMGVTVCMRGEATALRARNEEIATEVSRADAGRIAGIVAGGLGLVGLVTGAVLLARAPSMGRFAATPWVSPSGTGLRLSF